MTRWVSRGRLFGASAAVVAAALAVSLLPETRMQRIARLDLTASELPETYLMFSRSRPGRCRVQDRSESTTKRGDALEPGRTWGCERIPYDDAPSDGWLAQSAKHGRGTLLFVPIYAVDDWTYPYFYAFIRQREPELELPEVRWTQLFVDRLYHGLYLEVALPFDLRVADGGTGILRSIITIPADGGEARVLNTRLQEGDDAYALQATRDAPLRVSEQSEALSWLATLRRGDRTFLMSNLVPYDLSQLPMPVSPLEVYARREGREIVAAPLEAAQLDLASLSEQHEEPGAFLADPETSEPLRDGFERYAAELVVALRLEAALQDSMDRILTALPGRQTASERLGYAALELQ